MVYKVTQKHTIESTALEHHIESSKNASVITSPSSLRRLVFAILRIGKRLDSLRLCRSQVSCSACGVILLLILLLLLLLLLLLMSLLCRFEPA